MSAGPELLERVGRAWRSAEERRQARIQKMIEVVDARVNELVKHPKPEDALLWDQWMDELEGLADQVNYDDPQTRDRFERLVKWGYQLVLLERDPHVGEAGLEIPETQEEFDALPDALEELRRRRAV